MKQILFIITFLVLTQIAAMAQERKLQVHVDEKTELITTIQLLSGYRYLTEADIAYQKEVLTHFKRFQDHKAVKLYKTISSWFYGGAPLSFVSHYNFPDTKAIANFSAEDELTFSYTAKKDTLHLFLNLLVDFYKTSNFRAFYTSQQPFYAKISASVLKESHRVDYIGIMEKHFGRQQRAYKVILSPLQMDAGFGPMLETPKGNILYAFIGPRYDSKDMPVFDSEILFQELILHEFSHSFCNPLIDKNLKVLNADSCLLAPILKDQKSQGYGTWQTCLQEHWTRANEIVLNSIIYGQQVADTLLMKNIEEEKWIYLKGLVAILQKEYVTNRTQHPTLDTIMPKVIAYFNDETKNCR